MSNKINLNSFVNKEPSDVLVFNDGNAGRVKNVRIEVSKKKPDDKPNSPDYKLLAIDSKGADVNLGIYYPTERTKDSEIRIRMNQLVSCLFALNPSLKGKELPEFSTHKEAYDFLLSQIAKSSNGASVNVFVSYGTIDRPSIYLGFRAYNVFEEITADDATTQLKPVTNKDGYNDVMTRPQSTSFDEQPDEPQVTSENATEDWA